MNANAGTTGMARGRWKLTGMHATGPTGMQGRLYLKSNYKSVAPHPWQRAGSPV